MYPFVMETHGSKDEGNKWKLVSWVKQRQDLILRCGMKEARWVVHLISVSSVKTNQWFCLFQCLFVFVVKEKGNTEEKCKKLA